GLTGIQVLAVLRKVDALTGSGCARPSLGRCLLAQEEPQQRGLAGAVRADDAPALAVKEIEVEIAEQPSVAEPDAQPACLDELATAALRLEAGADLLRLSRFLQALHPVQAALGGARAARHLLGDATVEIPASLGAPLHRGGAAQLPPDELLQRT